MPEITVKPVNDNGRYCYKRRKPRQGLVLRFRLDIEGGLYAHVYIWDSEEAMYAGSYMDPPYTACFVGLEHVVAVFDECVIAKPGKWAEIHLEAGNFGAGVVAHELQHLINDLITVLNMDVHEMDEDIAQIAERLSRQFWDTIYDNFTVSSDRPTADALTPGT